jgi:hypothetical protein
MSAENHGYKRPTPSSFERVLSQEQGGCGGRGRSGGRGGRTAAPSLSVSLITMVVRPHEEEAFNVVGGQATEVQQGPGQNPETSQHDQQGPETGWSAESGWSAIYIYRRVVEDKDDDL